MEEITSGDAGLPVTTGAPPEHRRDRRHPWHYRGATKVLVRSTLHVLEAQALNLSLRGIGLEMREQLEVGMLLAIFPPRPQAAKACALTARVVRVQLRPGQRWYTGCALLRPLSKAEVGDFLA